jgi:hypothetical protein
MTKCPICQTTYVASPDEYECPTCRDYPCDTQGYPLDAYADMMDLDRLDRERMMDMFA